MTRGRSTAKAIARGAARVLVLPLYVSYRVRAIFFGEQAFRSSSQLVSLLPGLVGDYIRREFYRLTLDQCGQESQVVFGTIFASRSARVGEHVYIGSHCIIGDAVIGDDVLLGCNVHILSGNAQHGTQELDRPIRLQARRFETIRIGEDTWIGNGAIIMADVGKKCVIGAGSVVVSSIPDYSVVAGNPARVIRSRHSLPISAEHA